MQYFLTHNNSKKIYSWIQRIMVKIFEQFKKGKYMQPKGICHKEISNEKYLKIEKNTVL